MSDLQWLLALLAFLVSLWVAAGFWAGFVTADGMPVHWRHGRGASYFHSWIHHHAAETLLIGVPVSFGAYIGRRVAVWIGGKS